MRFMFFGLRTPLLWLSFLETVSSGKLVYFKKIKVSCETRKVQVRIDNAICVLAICVTSAKNAPTNANFSLMALVT